MSLKEMKTEIAKKIVKVRCDEDFILGVIGGLKTEAQAQKMLDVVSSGEHTAEQLLVASVYISRDLV